MKFLSVLLLALVIVFMGTCGTKKNNSETNNTVLSTDEMNSDNDTASATSAMNEQLNMLSIAPENSEPHLWSLKEVKDFFHKNKIGEAKPPVDIDSKLYFDEGEAFAGIGIHLNSYKYLNMYYKNILTNWQILQDEAPGVFLSNKDAQIIVKFANITETEFNRDYPNWRNGEPVDIE